MSSPHAPHLDATRARQGRWGRPVFWVLVISLALAVIAVFAAWAWHAGPYASAQHRRRLAEARQATGFSAPAPQPKWTPAPSSPAGVNRPG